MKTRKADRQTDRETERQPGRERETKGTNARRTERETKGKAKTKTKTKTETETETKTKTNTNMISYFVLSCLVLYGLASSHRRSSMQSWLFIPPTCKKRRSKIV